MSNPSKDKSSPDSDSEILLSALRSSTYLNPTLNLHKPSSTLYISPSLTSTASCALVGISPSSSSGSADALGGGDSTALAGYTGLGMLRSSTFSHGSSNSATGGRGIDADQVESAIKLGCAGREECLLLVPGRHDSDERCHGSEEDLLRVAIGMERVKDQLGLKVDWIINRDIDVGGVGSVLLCKILGAVRFALYSVFDIGAEICDI